MKLAARFPVTSFKPLLVAFFLFHLLLLLISFYQFGFAWQQLLIVPSLIISAYFNFNNYQKITRANDDLCWSGQSWLMHMEKSDSKHDPITYLKVAPNSWLTSQLSLLHFTSDTGNFSWLFSRMELGDRLYSHLVYLVRQDLKQNSKDTKLEKN